ncbi:ROK family transcriptional regulator [Streptomyces brasiliensis]|uniref:Sugar kinase n=1 Tax=Streptomyces brasiliensis TaxID=1954 RepID=A0A917L9R3_9ACTN|nr:ROK family transcriptional regulator [Streptomyces brasiliensis]GGJ53120.1 sugar kinase [Streptomyces brasiliensis]
MDAPAPALTTAADRISTADIREANVAALCTLLRENGGMTRADLCRASGLTRPTIMAVVQRLLAEGWVTEPGEARTPAGGGRPGSVLHFRADARVVAAIRPRAGQLEAVLADLTGTVVARSIEPSWSEEKPWTVLMERIAHQITELREANPHLGPLGSVAMSLPGSIDRAHGLWTLVRHSEWQDLPVGEALSDLMGVPVGVVNIVAAALIGGLAREPGQVGSASLVYVGMGVGGASTVQGRLIEGATGSAGELGHCVLPGLDSLCRCGRRGCVEAVTSARYLREEYGRLTGGPVTATLAEIERTTDQGVPEMIDQAAERLALAVSWMVNVINPSVVYFGGNSFTDGSTLFVDRFEQALRARAYRPNAESLTVRSVASDVTVAGGVHVASELLPPFLRPALRLVR